jgi:hypothetical protein
MNKYENGNPKINYLLTQKIIELHSVGYVFDFFFTGNDRIICLQDNRGFDISDVLISVIDQGFAYDDCKYMHTIDTSCGTKGILFDVVLLSSKATSKAAKSSFYSNPSSSVKFKI